MKMNHRPIVLSLASAFALWGLSLGCEHKHHVETETVEVHEAPHHPVREEVIVEQPPARHVIIQEAPPPEVVEVVPARPSHDVIWVKGYWVHSGGKYVWMKGRYINERRGYRYVHPHWEHTKHGWEFHEERWEHHH